MSSRNANKCFVYILRCYILKNITNCLVYIIHIYASGYGCKRIYITFFSEQCKNQAIFKSADPAFSSVEPIRRPNLVNLKITDCLAQQTNHYHFTNRIYRFTDRISEFGGYQTPNRYVPAGNCT